MSDKTKGKKDKKGNKKEEKKKENVEKNVEAGEEVEAKGENLDLKIYLLVKNYSLYVTFMQHLMIHLYM